jgi:GntR family transcriptional regulator/MocR family aminotransferase
LRSLVGDLVLVRLQEERDPLLHKRLYNALRRAILDGSLAPQSRLPPSRDLAGTWRIKKHHINNL